jgi:predicted DNA-binding transcriptional regulator YafY
MYSPTLRLLTLLELLESRERVTGAELAQTLEVSDRSVQRYVAQLQDLGIPVESTRGVGGAYRLKPGFRLPPLMLTDDEALAVSLGLRALEPLGLSAFAPATKSAQTKLERVLPRAIAEHSRIVQEAVELEPSPWLVKTDAKLLMLLAMAVQSRAPISFAYKSFDASESRREVEPYSVLHHDGRWCIAVCVSHQDHFAWTECSSLRSSREVSSAPQILMLELSCANPCRSRHHHGPWKSGSSRHLRRHIGVCCRTK